MKSKAVIEMTEGTDKKIEIKNGVPVVDRILKMTVPANYGFIPNTLAEDGDPLDIFIVSKKLLNTADEVDVEVLGIFECLDQGVADNKLFATIAGEKFDQVTLLKNLTQIGHYLLNYKEGFEVKNYRGLKLQHDDQNLLERYKV